MRDELWLKHDARSRLDPKMAHFIHLRGMMGYGTFWALIETLHYQNNHEIDWTEELPGIGFQLGFTWENFEPVVRDMVVTGLFKLEEGKLYQSKLKQEQANRSKTKQAVSEARKEAGRLGGLRSAEVRAKQKDEEHQEDASKSKQSQAKPLEESRIDKSRIENKDIYAGKPATSPKTPPGYREGCEQHGIYKHVWILPNEYQELCSKYGKVQVDAKVTSLDANIENKLKKYTAFKNHAACIRSWCTSDRSQGRVPREEPLPDGFNRIGKGLVRGPDGKTYQEAFLRNINFVLEAKNNG